ncbi:similar to Saccharomyces cerevisiae YOR305W RRG7 Protein of unknown function [Maudiozyma barnettii]|uniref:Required for respiratory growth protein 7, mitochondrial n=1 Tax=Maudiozyma barnettii TaxID=61262 RepID=A0A8H2VCU1_9SACH|nr:Rrg7p [Kazachstania barnettii]CAB4252937.1 similar to Saccharomyces cerevisiae YOR305W RRG7 Protein of unknown function [Kazachstania barnettii]CAD1780732.1 similar to Saccharomyces cerevisiae YOR305W RRG7 Protein of unknown function [Kazachstania barnettii]
MRITYSQVRKITNAAIERYISLNKHTAGSTVFQGTLYENIAMREMSQKLGMTNLERIGGAHDGGVDITGDWSVVPIYKKMEQVLGPYRDKIPKRCTVNGARLSPIANKIESGNEVTSLRALVQCKAFTSSKVTPKELRELVGTFGSLVNNSERDKFVVIMCSPHLLTKDGLKLINGLRIPLIYLRIGMLRLLQGQENYDFENSGKLINYFENEYAMQLLQGCRVNEWIDYDIYKNVDPTCSK